MVVSCGVSDRGPVRRTNEDSYLADDDLSLYIVADGMGGHAAGEVASRLTVESIENFIRRTRDTEDFSWPCGVDPALSLSANRLRTAIYLANRRVFREAEGQPDYTGMGSTVVCALVSGNRLTIGHVGDSRLYVLSRGVLTPLTRDDTWAEAVLAGQADGDPATLATHPMRHVLINVLGARDLTDIHVSERDLVDGETLLLCSDGLHGAIDAEELAGVLAAAGGQVETAARTLVDTAIARRTRDNVTAVVIRYADESSGG